MPAVQSRFVVRTFATFVFFSALAGQFWRSLFGWWGYGALALAVVAFSVLALVRLKPDWMWPRFPKSLIAFLGLATLSLVWSFYLGASLIGVTLQWATTLSALFLALCLSWAELLRTLGAALRWILALSLVFELIVAVFVRQAVLPFWVDYGTRDVPESFYWSRGILLQGGPIEGIVANRNLLGFLALIAVIVFAVQLAAGTVSRRWGRAWLGLGVLMLLLTRSATVAFAATAVTVVLLFALWARRRPPEGRRPVYLAAAASVLVGGVGLVIVTPQLLSLLGKSADLTGRLDIWRNVTALALERPVFGWGWVSYWAPWVEPFEGLAVRRGVVYLQAHNAWLDVWLQLGILGLIVFTALVFSTLWRSWFLAVDRPRRSVADTEPYAVSALLPLLLLVALLAQSLAESRILVESGWLLLVVLAVTTKRQQASTQRMP
ncbi:O-antigen ligase family protein [Cryobacterium cheniae]|uniref:O-antigen ligase family protein n=1 Tax=Cryobacterium cheniae TaxID=1259262 RepID=A0A4R8XY26_9MICO|nr:O-antigen ligase family protein [Cryobacterium cheniae]TFC84067.1 O-antigen ligase family protein [Cryobacterium cheniae]